MDSVATWYELGYVHSLREHYRVILIDARGHGESDKPHSSDAYALKYIVSDIIAVMDHLSVPTAHYFGYSLGGFIGFGLAKYAPLRFSSLVIGGSNPYRHPSKAIDSRIKRLGQGPEGVLDVWGSATSPLMRARLVLNDVKALCAYLIQRRQEPSLETVLSSITIPCLLFAGEADWTYPRTRECARCIPGAKFIDLPGLDHVGVLNSPHVVMEHIIGFLKAVNAGEPGGDDVVDCPSD
jgi:pimeloyl-ACP methyl ester carboxylesterase